MKQNLHLIRAFFSKAVYYLGCLYVHSKFLFAYLFSDTVNQWRTEGVVWEGSNPPPPKIPKALQNQPDLKTVKNC